VSLAKVVLICVAVVVLAMILAECDQAHDLSAQEQVTAETGARRTLTLFESCSGRDSDGDGYVTCSGREKPGSEVVTLLCSYKNSSVGCKRK
jgi:hypothetical protein